MSAVKSTRPWRLAALPALVGVGALLLGLVAQPTWLSSRLQASTKADFSLSPNPGSASAEQGQVASYAVTEQKVNGFNSAVALAASGLPAGTTATFSPQALD